MIFYMKKKIYIYEKDIYDILTKFRSGRRGLFNIKEAGNPTQQTAVVNKLICRIRI